MKHAMAKIVAVLMAMVVLCGGCARENPDKPVSPTTDQAVTTSESVVTSATTTTTQADTTTAEATTADTTTTDATTDSVTSTTEASTTEVSTTEVSTTTEAPTTTATTTTQKVTTTSAPTTKVPATTEKTTTTEKSTAAATTTTTTTTTTKATTTTTATKVTTTTKPVTGQKHTALSTDQRYYYTQLDASQKEWYMAIHRAVQNLKIETEKFYVDPSYTDNGQNSEAVFDVFYAYLEDHPECFYVSASAGISYTSSHMYLFRLNYSAKMSPDEQDAAAGYQYGEMTAAVKNKILAKKAKFDAKVQDFISTIPANAPDVVKERMAYDRLLLDSHYDLDAVNNNQWDGMCEDSWTAYGIMMDHAGVCESYTESMQVLCHAMGIQCVTIQGKAEGGGHKWDAVQLDGEWYMCDVTFDDPVGGDPDVAYHDYFNRTEKWFKDHGHYWGKDTQRLPLPKCNGTKYAFEKYFTEG